MRRTLRAAFFDMGGTLVEGPGDEDLWYPAVMERVAREFGPRPWAELLYRTDLGRRATQPYRQETNRWIADWLREQGESLNDADVERVRRAFAAPLPAAFSLTPGAADALRWCKTHGLSVAVLTNTFSRGDDDVWLDWKRFGLEESIDHIVSSHSTGWVKPHAAMFERALSLSGVSPDEAFMVGDEFPTDIVGAKRVGIRAIWVHPAPTAWPQYKERADETIPSLLTLPSVVEPWLVN